MTVTSPLESAIVVPIPEVEDLVAPWRRQYDPSASLGVPAHVTLLGPFKAPGSIDASVTSALEAFFRSQPSFSLTFAGVCAFRDVLYLAPESDGALENLIHALVARYPETPPYGGRFAHIVPHLTVAQREDSDDLTSITERFCLDAASRLPIQARVNCASLLVQGPDGLYHQEANLPFAAA